MAPLCVRQRVCCSRHGILRSIYLPCFLTLAGTLPPCFVLPLQVSLSGLWLLLDQATSISTQQNCVQFWSACGNIVVCRGSIADSVYIRAGRWFCAQPIATWTYFGRERRSIDSTELSPLRVLRGVVFFPYLLLLSKVLRCLPGACAAPVTYPGTLRYSTVRGQKKVLGSAPEDTLHI